MRVRVNGSGAVTQTRRFWPKADLLLLSPGVQDLRPRSRPHAGMAHEMLERALERADAIGLADRPRMQRDAHDAAAVLRGFLVQQVELVRERDEDLVLVVAHA